MVLKLVLRDPQMVQPIGTEEMWTIWGSLRTRLQTTVLNCAIIIKVGNNLSKHLRGRLIVRYSSLNDA